MAWYGFIKNGRARVSPRWTPFWLWSFVLVIMGTGSPVVAANSSALCIRWYKQKRFLEASRCFVDVVRKFESQKLKPAVRRQKVNPPLRNAALSLIKAAKQQKTPVKAAYLREQALLLLRKFHKKKYYLSEIERQWAVSRQAGLQEKIGYTTLTVFVGASTAMIQVKGYKFEVEKKGNFVGKVRPGEYTIIVKYSPQKMQAKVVKVQALQPKVMTFTPPAGLAKRTPPVKRPKVARVIRRLPPPGTAPKSRSRTVPWIVVGIGTTLVVGGGVSLLVAGLNLGARGDLAKQQQSDAKTKALTVDDTNNLTAAHQAADIPLAVGIAAASAGVVTVVVGVILYAMQPKIPPANMSMTPSKRTQKRGFTLHLFQE